MSENELNPWEGERPWAQYDFADIDAPFERWTIGNGLSLNRQSGEQASRFTYFRTPENECFRIVVEAPFKGVTRVHLWSVETWDDGEFHSVWRCELRDLARTLDHAHAHAQFLTTRPRFTK